MCEHFFPPVVSQKSRLQALASRYGYVPYIRCTGLRCKFSCVCKPVIMMFFYNIVMSPQRYRSRLHKSSHRTVVNLLFFYCITYSLKKKNHQIEASGREGYIQYINSGLGNWTSLALISAESDLNFVVLFATKSASLSARITLAFFHL